MSVKSTQLCVNLVDKTMETSFTHLQVLELVQSPLHSPIYHVLHKWSSKVQSLALNGQNHIFQLCNKRHCQNPRSELLNKPNFKAQRLII